MQVILAPSNLGLRPLRPGHEPGTWRAPATLVAAGLLDAVGADDAIALPRPRYSSAALPGTRLLNGHTMRAFNLALAAEVAAAHRRDAFAFVVGGDCSILLGALAGARQAGSLALVHIDGHSDFRHPGNYDSQRMLGAAAGMDLALATGRGEPLATVWPGITGPLVSDDAVVQLGERESRDADFAWPDIARTAITRIDVFDALASGAAATLRTIRETLDRDADRRYWVHFDVDVLDAAIMPAVDSPGSPGIPPDDLVAVMAPLIADPRCCGMTVTVFDPERDPDGRYAAAIVQILARLPWRAVVGSMR